MSVEIVMPKLSDTMEEGTILKWLKRAGDAISRGEPIAEVETDKADMELEAEADGVLREIKVAEGESVAVGAVIALMEEGAAVGGGAPETEGIVADDPSRDRAVEAQAGSAAAGSGVQPGHASSSHGGRGGFDDGDRVMKASPAARKIAEERGVDLRSLKGSGPAGRIVKEDVETAAAVRKPAAADREPAPASESRRAQAPVVERQQLSRMRQSIARRMSEAFRDIPHFYVTAEIDMGEATRLKRGLEAGELFAVPVTYTHMVLKATAQALKRHPRLNSSYRDNAIEMKGEINIGMVVALEDGLIVPILRRADQLSLEEIAIQARRLVEQARQGRFASEDLSGGTFTVSNMGMLDIEHFAAVVNPPQAAVLAVGAIQDRPVVRDGAVVPGRTMRVTVSCDHRIVDGVAAGRFLEELKRLLENPLVLLVRHAR